MDDSHTNYDNHGEINTSDDATISFDGKVTQVPGISGLNLTYRSGDTVGGDYLLTKRIGQGGMGAVFSCHHQTLDREYALKILSANQLSSEAWTRFQQEAQVLAKLHHPNIISIYNMGIDKGQCPYYVMDLLTGQTFDEIIKAAGRLSLRRVLDTFIPVANALQSAHINGVIHRDIKPSNLMLTNASVPNQLQVKLVDFGIARVSKGDLSKQSQTATGIVFGTPFYMSPEQCQGTKVDERSDIYSLGCTLFEALTGSPPIVGENAFDTFLKHQTLAPPTLQSMAPDVIFPESIELAVQKMLRKSVSERYQTMAQVEVDLKRIQEGKPIMGQPLPIAAVVKGVAQPDGKKKKKTKTLSAKQKIVLSIASSLLLAGTVTGAFYLTKSKSAQNKLRELAATWTGQKNKKVASKGPQPIVTDPGKKTGKRARGISENSSYFDYIDVAMMPTELLKKFGASEQELERVTPNDIVSARESMDEAEILYHQHEDEPFWKDRKFRTGNMFKFFDDMSIGTIQIGDGKLVSAKKTIVAPKNEKAFLYINLAMRNFPVLLDRFGPGDLTGLALTSSHPDDVIAKISDWTRLEELDFFNPLLKTMPDKRENLDESDLNDKYLNSVDKIKGLKTLGLCGPATGRAIAKMSLLKTISALKLKRIDNFRPLLTTLPKLDNLKELWLVRQDTGADQLAILKGMKNLEHLKILRSNIGLDCLKYFQAMPALKTLRLDRNDWSSEQKAEFQKQLPKVAVSYEPVVESTYWEMAVDKKNELSDKK